MNKDALYATLIGLGIGLLLTGIILVGPTVVKSMPKIALPNINVNFSFLNKKQTPTPTSNVATQELKHEITIDSPLPEGIETTETVLLSGTTSKESIVSIQGALDDSVIATNGDGKFAGKITLIEGKNDIVVTSFHDNQTAIQNRTIYYTPEQW